MFLISIIPNTNNKITYDEYINAINEKITIAMSKYKRYDSTILFYKDLVLNELKNINLKYDTLEVYTAFNSEINSFTSEYINNNQIYSDLSIMILDNEGKIVSSLSKDYYTSTYNVGVNSKRMIGSTIKAMLYSGSEPSAFRINILTSGVACNYNGYTYADVVDGKATVTYTSSNDYLYYSAYNVSADAVLDLMQPGKLQVSTSVTK